MIPMVAAAGRVSSLLAGAGRGAAGLARSSASAVGVPSTVAGAAFIGDEAVNLSEPVRNSIFTTEDQQRARRENNEMLRFGRGPVGTMQSEQMQRAMAQRIRVQQKMSQNEADLIVNRPSVYKELRTGRELADDVVLLGDLGPRDTLEAALFAMSTGQLA